MLTNENYYATENNIKYMGATQFKTFIDCPARTIAEMNGSFEWEKTTSLLVGSYVDAHFEGTLDIFKEKNPEIFLQRGTGLKAEYRQAEQIINRLENDVFFMKYMAGKKQVIQTGAINSIDFKIKIDVLHEGKAIVDLKIIKDFESAYDPSLGKRINFVQYWGYDTQAAIYQEIERQNRGEDAEPLPFFIAAATKEKFTDFNIIHIPQEYLDAKLEIVKTRAPEFAKMKLMNISEVPACGLCDYCKSVKKLNSVISLEDIA